MPNPSMYRMRLRFRLSTKLNINASELPLEVGGREVVLRPEFRNVPINQSEWLVMNSTGFSEEEEARRFGHKLRTALELSSVATRLGVDAGRDLATSGFGREFRTQIAKDTGVDVRSNIHGLDVFPDDPNVGFFNASAAGSVLRGADEFLRSLAEVHETATTLSKEATDMILLLNYALMRPDPVTRIVFAFSAVEMLGQKEIWSPNQKIILEDLARAAETASIGDEAERLEVSDALRKSLHRVSLRQGVMRLLATLGLPELRTTWDRIYAERSSLVHGLAPIPGADYSDLAHRSVSLCGRILLKAIADEFPYANQYLDRFYQTG